MLSRTILLFLLIIGCSHSDRRVKRIVGGIPADEPPPGEAELVEVSTPESGGGGARPLVFERKEKKTATVQGVQDDDGTYKFLGLRYAESPIGRLRFQRPKRLRLSGEIEATRYCPPCPQSIDGNDGYIGKEDCLCLNIFSPKLQEAGGQRANLPVLVWIHGGHFRRGSSAQYDPKPLVKKGIVVVTLQYRLGSLGFLSIGRKELPGNVGLFDMNAALWWIHEYIHHFGGNPERIIVAGQGSGASAASMLAMNKMTKGIAGVFAMSGSPISPFSVDKQEAKTSKEVSALDGCASEDGLKFVKCMQKLPLQSIMEGDNKLQGERIKKREFPNNLASLNGPAPSEEGSDDTRFLPNFLVEPPLESVKKGKFPPIPLLTGVTKEETSSGVQGNFLEQVASKLTSPSFLENGLFNDLLKSNTGLYQNKSVDPNLQSLFSSAEYLNCFTKVLTSAVSDIEKVIKHTTDAFFNLPAFVMGHLWSKRSKVYLYSFEHTPKESKANTFLSGLPLAKGEPKKTEKKKGPSHGDDIVYLFNLQTMYGGPLNNSLTADNDRKVREHFTTVVAEFAKTGVPKVTGGSPAWPPFSGSESNYMVIEEPPKLGKNFRKCQMGLWTGDANILNSVECSFIGPASEIIENTVGTATSTLLQPLNTLKGGLGATKPLTDAIANPVGAILNPFGALGGQQQKTPSSKTPETKKPNSGGLLGLGLGGGGLGWG